MSEHSSDVTGFVGPTAEDVEDFATDHDDCDPHDYLADSDDEYSSDLHSCTESDAATGDEQEHSPALFGSPPAYEEPEAAAQQPDQQLVEMKAQLTLFQRTSRRMQRLGLRYVWRVVMMRTCKCGLRSLCDCRSTCAVANQPPVQSLLCYLLQPRLDKQR